MEIYVDILRNEHCEHALCYYYVTAESICGCSLDNLKIPQKITLRGIKITRNVFDPKKV